MNSVKLVTVTPEAEKTMGYVARVSNPNNQENPKVAGLLKYCINHQHWSVFEQAHMTLEIETTRAIAAQILRHRSFTFQEFSQRYADSSMLSTNVPMFDLRRQDDKNRQNSIDDVDPFLRQELEIAIEKYFNEGMDIYRHMLDMGIAKECARMVLPLATPTPKSPTAPGVAFTTSTASSIIVLCFWMFAPFSDIAIFRFTPLSLSVLLANISDKI